MLYIKTRVSENIEIKVDLYEDEIYTQCPLCSKEMQVGFEELKDLLNQGGDFSSTVWYCEECSPKVSVK